MPIKKQTKKSLTKKMKHSAHQVIIPQKFNHFQPHLVRTSGIIMVVLAVLFLQFSARTLAPKSVLGESSDVTSQALLDETNHQREAFHLKDLRYNHELSVAATEKARDMLASQYWSHTSPSGLTPWYWMKQSGYSYAYAGENLARGFATTSGVTTAWMNSTEHRENLLNTHYRDVGFAVVNGTLDGKKTNVIVAMYGSETPTAAAAAGETNVLAPSDGNVSLIARFGIGLQSLSPAALASIFLLVFAVAVALAAHAHRRKLPKYLQKSWRRHHGLYKALGMSSLAVIVIALYGSGQI